MAVFETWLRSDLKKPVQVVQLTGNLFSADNGGNLIGVEVFDDGEQATLTGAVTGYIIRADGQTVIVEGSLTGNKASIVLPASAYVSIGQVSIVIKNGSTTLGACVAYVYRTTTDTIVDPAHVIPSLDELLAQIETMRQLSATVTAQEADRVTAETGRVNAEQGRTTAESSRASAESARASAESDRATAESARAASETSRKSAETARASAESGRASAETARVSAETARAGAESVRDTAETARASAESARASAESSRASAETARANAETARANAETARASAETQRESDFATAKAAAEGATSAANTAAGKINNMTVAANGLPAGSSPTVAISEVDGHKHIVFGLVKGDPGKDFEIRKTFTSIAQMQAYDPDTDPSTKKVRENDFVMIDTGSVQDVDTGKLYCYEPTTQDVWRYIGDLSGSQGIKGETGTGIANITLNQDYTLTITMDDGQTSYTTGSIRGAQGQQGEQGDPGNDGYSPTVTVTTITGGHRVSVTDATGTNTFDVFDGADGTDGVSAYMHIRYSQNQPTSDSDMSTTPNDWIGIYSGTSATAPTAYTDYAWYKIKGETGQVENVYGSTVPMSPSDSTKLKDAIDGKADKDTNAVTGNFASFDANGNPVDSGHKHGDYLTQHQDISGKADKVQNATTNNFAGLDANGNLKDSGKAASDFVAANQGSGNAGKYMKVGNDGTLTPETLDIVNNLTTDDATKALSAAMGKELNSKTASYEFTTEYSSILAMVNDQVTTKGKKLPFSFVKVQGGSLTDVPSGWESNELTGIVDGNGARLNVTIQRYGAIRSEYTRDIFSGNWLNQWYSVDQKIATTNNELASVENGLAYRETGTTASRNISDGEYVFWNGAMYKANGNIASGTTLVSGTNLTPTENALNALNSKMFPDFSNLIDKITLASNPSQVNVTTLQQDSFIVADIFSSSSVQGYLVADDVQILCSQKFSSDNIFSCILPKGTVIKARNTGDTGYIKIYGLKE